MPNYLNIGDIAPDFSAPDQNENIVTLSSFRGSKVALYFYPKDDTPGCTKQACNIRDNYQALLEAGIRVLGVSADSVESHKKFAQKYQLPFPILADPEKNIINAYGVFGEKNVYGKKTPSIFRTTYLIDENGVIQDIIKQVKTEDHTSQILKKIQKP
ncbi:MAG: thioredoxin-dependent thiol peroxidase [Bacteroidia bacterium]|nr:thioredoxin-dependent thiol peroxidase [Bacteroidia bacterium]MDW8158226.1 thioredoxin-dependent thiol peroxidase [Bacteroidia bacterium]